MATECFRNLVTSLLSWTDLLRIWIGVWKKVKLCSLIVCPETRCVPASKTDILLSFHVPAQLQQMQITDAAEQKSVMVGFLDLFYILYKVQILRCFFFFNGLTEITKINITMALKDGMIKQINFLSLAFKCIYVPLYLLI